MRSALERAVSLDRHVASLLAMTVEGWARSGEKSFGSFLQKRTSSLSLVVNIQNLRPGHQRDVVVLKDVVVEGFEVFDTVGDACQIGVDGNRHDARDFRAFLVETVELVAAAAEDFVGGLLLDGADGDVVDFDGVGDGD